MKLPAENRAAARARKAPASLKKPGAVVVVAQGGEGSEHGERIEREADRQEIAPDDVSEQPFGGVRQEPVPGAGGRPR